MKEAGTLFPVSISRLHGALDLMAYEKLDDDELLRLSLAALNSARDADALVMLKDLVERSPGNALAQYLLAAEYAQMGLWGPAESGFRTAVEYMPELSMARFQLGQLLMLKGAKNEARQVFAAVRDTKDEALALYAGALGELMEDRVSGAIECLEAGLARAQSIPALEVDMQRLLRELKEQASQRPMEEERAPLGASMLLSNYGRYH